MTPVRHQYDEDRIRTKGHDCPKKDYHVRSSAIGLIQMNWSIYTVEYDVLAQDVVHATFFLFGVL